MENIQEVKVIYPYGFIYITTNMVNGKKYIGQRKFSCGWNGYLGSGVFIKRAINKYSKDNFIREIIAVAYSKEELNELEKEFIKNHNAVESADYYNLVEGGGATAGYKFSDESKQNMSLMRKGMGKGRSLSEETKLKISKLMKTYFHNRILTFSDETRQKMSNSKKGDKNPNFNKNFSKEYRKKLSDAKIKFNSEQILEIREKYSTEKYTQTELAKEYEVSLSVINKLVNFKGVYKIS